MRPIFREEIDLLKENFGITIPEGCWYNKSWVIQFNEKLEKTIIGQLVTTVPYTICFKKSKRGFIKNSLSHREYLLKASNYKEKLKWDIVFFKKYIDEHPEHKIMVMNSTGKDSIVAEYLVKLVSKNFTNIFNNTSLESGKTLLMAKKLDNVKIINPKIGFYNWIKGDNVVLPTRAIRKCCDIFKENQVGKHLDPNDKIIFVSGMRNSESRNRANYTYEMKNDKWDKKEMKIGIW